MGYANNSFMHGSFLSIIFVSLSICLLFIHLLPITSLARGGYVYDSVDLSV